MKETHQGCLSRSIISFSNNLYLFLVRKTCFSGVTRLCRHAEPARRTACGLCILYLFCKRDPLLHSKQRSFAPKASGISMQRTVCPHHPVAWQENRDRISAHCASHGAGRSPFSSFGWIKQRCKFPVTPGRAIGDPRHGRPDSFLKGGASRRKKRKRPWILTPEKVTQPDFRRFK